MNDKELELAAKASGGLAYVPGTGWIHENADGTRGAWWHPLTDDGDALRLAVKLCLLVNIDLGISFVTDGTHDSDLSEKHGSDPCAATRRAIVRAAAEIGKAMP